MSYLAIRGHETRGKEVIEILEMFGASNPTIFEGSNDDWYYCIENGEIALVRWLDDFIVFTLEEFLKKFPYKIGDKVDYIKYGDEEFSVYKIMSMMWTGNTIAYTLDSFGLTCLAKDIRLHKENNMNKRSKGLESLNVETYLKVWDETEHGLEVCVAEGYELIEKDGQFYIIKQKSEYPIDYDECCEVLMGKTGFQDYSLQLTKLSTKINEANTISPEPPHITLINNFYKLIICRDAYRKIASEQMGLEKLWNPDWKDDNQRKWTINFYKGEIDLAIGFNAHFLLAFPTEEMRDAFYENFKDLIEECKELL